MLHAQRRQIILERLERNGQVSVASLSQEWQVSEDTVRRDLRDLDDEGLVRRVHGGALRVAEAEGDYQRREGLSTDVKARLGRCAAGLILSGQTVALDGGTTTLQLVRALPRDLRATVVTHSPLLAAELSRCPSVEVLLLGGRLFRHSQVAVGSETTRAIGRLRVDRFFLGATGLHHEAGATTGDWEEAAVKRAFCESAAETVLLVSPEKWNVISPHQIVSVTGIDALVVDIGTSDETLAPYRAVGLTVHTALD